MAPSEAERLATVEQILRDLGEDLRERKEEEKRARKRLHDLEGMVGALVDVQKQNRRGEAEQYRRLELRVQVLTLAVGFAAIASPIIVAILTGK